MELMNSGSDSPIVCYRAQSLKYRQLSLLALVALGGLASVVPWPLFADLNPASDLAICPQKVERICWQPSLSS